MKSSIIKRLNRYLIQELKDKLGQSVPEEPAIVGTCARVPCQSNFFDCGVFVLHYVELFLADPDLAYESFVRFHPSLSKLSDVLSAGEWKRNSELVFD